MENLVGQKFGFWTVLEFGEKGSKKCPRTWKCQCFCGSIQLVRERHLRIGKSKSCNCGLNRRVNMTGFKKNSWEVIKLDETQSDNGHGFWICRCVCGYEKFVHGGDIRRGKALNWCECKESRKMKYDEVFFSNIDLKTDGCWLWKGLKDRKGYGTLGQRVRAHRFSYEMFYGAITDGLYACHDCDNPSCVNPDHIYLGDPASNSRDMVLKGRSAKQETHSQAKLNWQKVEEIRKLFREGNTRKWISQKFNVNRKTISAIVNYTTWVKDPDIGYPYQKVS